MSRTDDPGRGTREVTVDEALPAGSLAGNVLVTGPTLGNTDRVAFDLLAERSDGRARSFAVTATEPAAQFRARVDRVAPPDLRAEDLYVIDCTESSGATDAGESPTCLSATPADLTGVGICLAKGYDRFGTGGGRVVLVDNLSTFLVYSDVDRIYRFVSTVNRRVREAGDITLQVLDADAVSTVNRNKLFQLFPTVVEVREDDGATLFRARGDTETAWHRFRPRGGERR